MPIYEYKCKKGHVFEVIQRMGESFSNCPYCKGGARKLVSIPSVLKGKGIWVFDREYGGEILHDRKLSKREKIYMLSKRGDRSKLRDDHL
jgi:putative FmdB family regulatory protein